MYMDWMCFFLLFCLCVFSLDVRMMSYDYIHHFSKILSCVCFMLYTEIKICQQVCPHDTDITSSSLAESRSC